MQQAAADRQTKGRSIYRQAEPQTVLDRDRLTDGGTGTHNGQMDGKVDGEADRTRDKRTNTQT